MRKNSAITLVALVITVIVLLILAGVAISAVTGGEGLFSKVKLAADKYNNSVKDEEVLINNVLENLNLNKDNEPKFEMTRVFEYTGNYETFTVPKAGLYQIELWGAQGGMTTTYAGYLGGYVKGEILLNEGENLYVYVGQTGQLGKSAWNGGGFSTNASGYAQKNSGGGATDIRLTEGTWDNVASLRSRIMVAGAGGAATTYMKSATNVFGAGGGLIGGRTTDGYGRCGYGGTQVAGGAGGPGGSTYGNGGSGSFGKGGSGTSHAWGGGSGYFGGGGGSRNSEADGGGGGGSSFISGHTGCIAITSANSQTPKNGDTTGSTNNDSSIHYSGKSFSNTIMIDGAGYNWTNQKGENIGMPNHDGTSTTTGNEGNGYAKIVYLR